MKKESQIFDKLTDLEIVALILKGDIKAIEFLFYNKCYFIFQHIEKIILKNNYQIDEIISETYLFISAQQWAVLKTYQGKSKLTSWFYKVTTRFFIRFFLKNDNHSEIICETLQIPTENNFHYNISKFELYDAINKLKNARYKQLLLLELIGYTHEELSKSLQTSSNNCYVLKHKSRKALLHLLTDSAK